MSNNCSCISIQTVGNCFNEGDKSLYRGIVKSSSSHVTLIPWGSDNVVKHNVCNNTQELYNVKTAGLATGSDNDQLKKWDGATSSICGTIYGGPHTQPSSITVDPSTCHNACGISTICTNNTTRDQARRPATGCDGMKVYTPTYSGNGTNQAVANGHKWHVINAMTNVEEQSIPFAEQPTIGDVYTEHPNWNNEQVAKRWQWQNVYGAVDAENGKVYGIPFGSPYVNILNTGSESSTWGTDEVKGNAPSTGFGTPEGNWDITHLNKYIGGVLASNGHIYSHGHKARSILKINVTTDEVTEIPYPTHIVNQMIDPLPEQPEVQFGEHYTPYRPAGYYPEITRITPRCASYGSVLGPDGKVYNVPRGIPYLIWIDPTNDSIGYMDISSELTTTKVGSSSSWYGDGVTHGDSIYYAPERAKVILKVTV